MAMSIEDDRVERLAEELSQMTGESKTAVILRALEERRERIAPESRENPRLAQALAFLAKEIWPKIPPTLLGRPMSKIDREQILGYGPDGM